MGEDLAAVGGTYNYLLVMLIRMIIICITAVAIRLTPAGRDRG